MTIGELHHGIFVYSGLVVGASIGIHRGFWAMLGGALAGLLIFHLVGCVVALVWGVVILIEMKWRERRRKQRSTRL